MIVAFCVMFGGDEQTTAVADLTVCANEPVGMLLRSSVALHRGVIDS